MSGECWRRDFWRSFAAGEAARVGCRVRYWIGPSRPGRPGTRIRRRRVRVDEVSVDWRDDAEADRDPGTADHGDDLVVARPFDVDVAHRYDEVTDANAGHLPTHTRRQTRHRIVD